MSISFKISKAFDASWIGPPNLLNLSVRSNTITSICGFFDKDFAKAKPPTPAPATNTFKGFCSEISSTYLSGVAIVVEAVFNADDDDDDNDATPEVLLHTDLD